MRRICRKTACLRIQKNIISVVTTPGTRLNTPKIAARVQGTGHTSLVRSSLAMVSSCCSSMAFLDILLLSSCRRRRSTSLELKYLVSLGWLVNNNGFLNPMNKCRDLLYVLCFGIFGAGRMGGIRVPGDGYCHLCWLHSECGLIVPFKQCLYVASIG